MDVQYAYDPKSLTDSGPSDVAVGQTTEDLDLT